VREANADAGIAIATEQLGRSQPEAMKWGGEINAEGQDIEMEGTTMLRRAMILALACASALGLSLADAVFSGAFAAQGPNAPAPDPALFRPVDPNNLLVIETTVGAVAVEMAPRAAPAHVARFRELAREQFYDGLVFHRVIDRFMAQIGDPTATGAGGSSKPDLKAEFSFRRGSEAPLTPYASEVMRLGAVSATVQTGFIDAMPVASQPDALRPLSADGKVNTWVLHCKGIVSTARLANNVDSGNSQIFLMRGDTPSLDGQYTAWGRIIDGQAAVDRIAVGTVGQMPEFKPDAIIRMRVAADIPAAERPHYWIERTDTPAFVAKLERNKRALGSMAKLCAMPIETIRTQ
jgi:peptidylprolyl isomerase